jgi:hypothetical protein
MFSPYPTLPPGALTADEALSTGAYGLQAYALACGLDIKPGARRSEVVRALWAARCLIEDPVTVAIARGPVDDTPPDKPIVRRGPGFNPYAGLRTGTDISPDNTEAENDQ